MMGRKSHGANQFIVGIVLAVLTFWLFAQSMINIIPAIQKDLGVSLGTLNIATSLTSLFSGLFIVVAGGLSDRMGRKKLTYIGLMLSIVGCLLIIFSQNATLLIIGRVVQGISAACIMPATIALIKAAFDGKDRQRALSYWSFGSWGGWFNRISRWSDCHVYGLEVDLCCIHRYCSIIDGITKEHSGE
jgi:DHA2 family multidrug resistance protein-like MFS transporter